MIRPSRKHAFTLVETLLVVAITGILSTAAVLSLAEPLAKARASEAVARVSGADAVARSQAKRSNRPVRLIIDLDERLLLRAQGNEASPPAALPRNYRVAEVRTSAGRQTAGRATIECSAVGASESYALRLTGPNFDQWLIFSGLTGHCSPVRDESQLSLIFDAVSDRPHAR